VPAYAAPQISLSAPDHEIRRQRAVSASGLLQAGPDAQLQQIVERAAKLAHTPIAAVSIIGRSRQWFVAKTGVERREFARSTSFCAHAIHRPGETMIVPDAVRDARFADNALVRGAPGIRFYAGVPLIDRNGYALGALCVIDDAPRDGFADAYGLSQLAREVERIMAR
jgi:GAF domain-containing protein